MHMTTARFIVAWEVHVPGTNFNITSKVSLNIKKCIFMLDLLTFKFKFKVISVSLAAGLKIYFNNKLLKQIDFKIFQLDKSLRTYSINNVVFVKVILRLFSE